MYVFRFVLLLAAVVQAAAANAHGPQIQITGESGQIVTRRLLGDGPYSDTLTAPTSVYVIPLREHLGVWYPRPNGTLALDGSPEYFSGPGIAYGYGYDSQNPSVTPFTVGAKFQLRIVDGLKRWNGSAFVDAGTAQMEAFTGGNPNSPTSIARTSDLAPFAALELPPGAGSITFAASQAEVHDTARYRLLGDGASPASASADGVYLLSLQLGISSNDKTPSAPFYFVLNKNTPATDVNAAVASLNFAPQLVQFVVPEPTSTILVGAAIMGTALFRRLRKATA